MARKVAKDRPSIAARCDTPVLTSSKGVIVMMTASQVGMYLRRTAHSAAPEMASSASGCQGRCQNTAIHTARQIAAMTWR